MSPDDFQQAWHAHSSQTRITVNADLLLQMVRRSQQEFRMTIFLRDCREIGVALVMLPLWFYLGYKLSPPWTWYLAVPGLLWIIAFMLVDRKRHKPNTAQPSDSLRDTGTSSLAQVDHQIWLLRNVLWWYLLPCAIPISIFFVHVSWLTAKNAVEALASGGMMLAFSAAVYGFIYYINQYAVPKQLIPRRQELLALLSSLNNDTTADTPPDLPILTKSSNPATSRRGLFVGIASVAFCMLGIIPLLATINGCPKTLSRTNRHAEISFDDPDAGLKKLVPQLRKEKNLVGLAAMVTVDNKVIASAVDGERKEGSDVKLTIDDCWHLGSISKSVTATMIARLVESGMMQWTDPISKYFPESSVNEDWKSVTLNELLTHTAGAPANFPMSVALQHPALGSESTKARHEAVLDVLAKKPETKPGTRFAYSNVGFTIAGAMAEKATGETWNALVQREVYEPLRLKGAGFGPPKSSDDKLEQPRGHTGFLGWKIAASDTDDNSSIIAPAGWVHMTLADLCAYATEQLHGELGTGKLLSADTYELLHTPNLEHYARGWVKNDPGDAIPHTVLWHNGSNTMWYALVAFIPDLNMVVAVASNDGDVPSAEGAAWEIVNSSVKHIGTTAQASH